MADDGRRFEVKILRPVTIDGKPHAAGSVLTLDRLRATSLAESGAAMIRSEIGRRGPPVGVLLFS